MTPAVLKTAVAGVLALLLLTAGATWKVQEWRYGKQLAEQSGAYQSDLTAISNAASDQVRTALEKQQVAEKIRDDIDAKATKEKTHDLAENETLRRAVADGARRLRIAGSCSANSGNVPGTASTTSLGNGGTVELAPAAGRAVFDIRAGIIADQVALKAAQAYIKDVCR
ncbi:lysis system i-spanin subunit Rz [Pseudomonas sp. 11/12A]|uniref:lysis system i-spanin subunit Rz n=1 Tax=Pseudomonas sp. 11/12A TaxID=1506582 RepID=UPI00068B199F|nr:lysis system i-spanin subunit Rz [Pseudomonas sp. 11/12A]